MDTAFTKESHESVISRIDEINAKRINAQQGATAKPARDYRYHEVIRLAGEVITEAARADAVCSAGLKEREDVFVNMLLHQFKQLADELNFETKEIGV
jgi:hypothetical protein